MINLKKSLVVLAALLGLLCVGVASADNGSKTKAKRYEITLTSNAKIGAVVLPRGEYKFKFDGTNATFTKEGGGKTYTAPAKLEPGKEDFAQTMMHFVQDGDDIRILSIDLKGTQTLLKFN